MSEEIVVESRMAHMSFQAKCQLQEPFPFRRQSHHEGFDTLKGWMMFHKGFTSTLNCAHLNFVLFQIAHQFLLHFNANLNLISKS
jgi:hypothetical protein